MSVVASKRAEVNFDTYLVTVEGEPGIGKTSVWQAAVDRAVGADDGPIGVALEAVNAARLNVIVNNSSGHTAGDVLLKAIGKLQ